MQPHPRASMSRLNLAEFQRGGEWTEARTPPPSQASSSPLSLSRTSTSRLPFLRIASMGDHHRRTHHKALVFVFILLLGIIGGPLNYASKRAIQALLDLRNRIATSTDSVAWNGVLWVAYSIALLFFAILWTKLSPSAVGSGVSQMKVVLTGVDPNLYLPGYFSLSTLVAKLGGIIFCNAAGLVVGTEGAWTHLMSILTHQLLRLPFFAPLQAKPSTRLQLLAAASAVAVSSAFASPLGGVLFSIEVTATYYLISNYMKAFVGALGAAIVVQVTTTTIVQSHPSIYKIEFPSAAAPIINIPLAIPLGVFLGLLSALLIRIVRFLSDKRTAWRKSSSTVVRVLVTWVDPLCVVVLTSVLSFSPSAPYISPPDLPRFYMSANASSISNAVVDGFVPVVLLPLAITLSVPTGVGLPTFVMGAALGRVYGSLLTSALPDWNLLPQAYALIGAASMTGASTRTVSTAVIALETSASLAYMLPIFAATLVAIETSRAFATQSVYDATVNDLPYLPCLDFADDTTTADDIKEPHVIFVTRKPTLVSILVALNRMPGHDIPVVESEANRMLLGRISSRALCRVVARYYDAADLGDHRADCGLDDGECLSPTADPDMTADKSTWTSIKSAVTSLNHRDPMYGNSVDRLYCRALPPPPPPPSSDLPTARAEMGSGLNAANIIALLSQRWSADKKELLRFATTKLPASAVQALPISVSSKTLLEDIHMMFLMLRLDHCFVTNRGALVGVVTTNAVINASRRGSTHNQDHNRANAV